MHRRRADTQVGSCALYAWGMTCPRVRPPRTGRRILGGVVVVVLLSAFGLPRAQTTHAQPTRPDPRVGLDLRRFLAALGRSVPAIARDLAGLDTTLPAIDPRQGWDRWPAYGARHPDTGGPVCDPEVLGVLAADLATRRIAPLVMRSVGLPALAARTEQLAPLTEGRMAEPSAAPLLEAARAPFTVPAEASMRGRVRNALSGLAMNLRNLVRARAAPQRRVVEASVELAAVADRVVGISARPVVVQWARDVSAAYLEAARNQPGARQRCRGHHAPGAPIVE